MNQKTKQPAAYYPDTQSQAVLGQQGSQPQFLANDDHFKVVLRRLDPGEQIPVHPDALAVYHFLAGSGTMIVDDQPYPITAGATLITPAGSARGMQATTQVIFLAAKVV